MATAPTSEAHAFAITPTVPLIGREREMGDLRVALDAALAGRGRVVLVGGEPGIGKTRLASALAAEAEARGVPVWWGRGWEDGSAPAFWPWNAALRRAIDKLGPEKFASAAGPWASDLAHVFPVLRDRDPALLQSASWESDRARFRLFDIVSRFVAAVAKPAGLVVVLDDVHWADRSSLKLLEFIAADAHDSRVLVVATYRDTDVQPDGPFAATLSRLAGEPSTRRLSLGSLGREDCARWVSFAGCESDAAVLGDALYRETGGNAFFVAEIVQLLTSESDPGTAWDAQRVPHGVREVIARRFEQLCGDCRTTLEVAALFSDDVDVQLLAEVLDEPATLDHVGRAARARILVPSEEHPERYDFAHAVLRRVLADELQPSARAAWHARIAEVLERHAATLEVVTTDLVRHYAAGGTPDALRKAFDYACRGAKDAANELGWEEAIRLYEIALDVGARCGALDAERALELRVAHARALRRAGDIPAARMRCEEIMAACRRTGRPSLLARAALVYVAPMPEFGLKAARDRAVLEEACRVADQIDDGLRARVYARLAGDLMAANEMEQADRVLHLCDEAASAAQRAGDAGALAMALLGAHYASAFRFGPKAGDERRPPQRRGPRVREVLQAAEDAGEHQIVASMRHLRSVGLFALGEPERFSAEVDALVAAGAASRAPEQLCLGDALLSFRAMVQGRFDEARDFMESALATGRRFQLANAVGQHRSQRIMLHFVLGRLPEIADELGAFVAGHSSGIGWEPVHGLARLAMGDAAGARAEYRMLLARGFATAQSGVMARCYLAGLALLCVALGEAESAPALYDLVDDRKDVWSVDGCQTLGPWSFMLGELARLCGRPGEAVAQLEKAIAVARRMRARPFVAEAQAALAEARIAADPAAANDPAVVALLDEAGHTADELGLLGVAARLQRLRRTQAPAPRPESGANSFRCDGDVWTIAFGGSEIRVKDGKGPRYLATLLAAPGHEFHVLQLASGPSGGEGVEAASDELTVGGLGGELHDAPDAVARRQYRERLDDIRSELEEAEERRDTGRAERLRSELEVLVSQLAQQFGSRPRTRGPAETARKAVTKVLRTQIGKLIEVHPALGGHLRDAVRMGTFCSYSPRTPTDWEVVFRS
ncbi:MAG TPA: AAA family ATPase [Candidatus Binatia bacterium]|nr:AAA family ATPase [Candidatus Binatia bacterium]